MEWYPSVEMCVGGLCGLFFMCVCVHVLCERLFVCMKSEREWAEEQWS